MKVEYQFNGRGLDVLASGLAALPDAVAEEAQGIVFDESQKRVPVRTGALKASATKSREGRFFIVRYVGGDKGRQYAMYVEYGTSRMAARPYLRPAFNAVPFDKLLAAHTARALRRAGR